MTAIPAETPSQDPQDSGAAAEQVPQQSPFPNLGAATPRRGPAAAVRPFPWGGFLFFAVVAGAIFFVAYQLSGPLAGVLYCITFLALAFTRQEIALLLIFASAFFQNDLSGTGPVRFSLAELNLALTIPVVIAQSMIARRKLTVGPILIPVILYFAICIFASLRDMRSTTIVSLAQMFLYLVATVVVFSSLVGRPHLLLIPLQGCVLVGTIMSILGMLSGYHIFGLHKNGWGGSLATALVIAIELWFATPPGPRAAIARRLLIASIIILTMGLVFSVSRGGWMAALSGLLTIALLRRQYKFMFKAAMLLVPLIVVCWFAMPEESRAYAMGFDDARWNIQKRHESNDYAVYMFRQSPIIGSGVGLRKEFDATNIIFTTLAETGIVGLAAFLLIHVVFLRMVWVTHSRVPVNSPLFPLVVLGAALVIGRMFHGLVDHYWSRGAITPAWAAAGMATMVYYLTRAPRTAKAKRREKSPKKSAATRGRTRALQYRM